MLKADYFKYTLVFKTAATTSRDVMLQKETWFVKVWNDEDPELSGLGECALFRGLSSDDRKDYEAQLARACTHVADEDLLSLTLNDWPSIRFGMETALADLAIGGRKILHPSAFTTGFEGIPINGLIWMGAKAEMLKQIRAKIDQGFRCLKLKVGAISIDEELELLKYIRREYNSETLEIRLDANGAFDPSNALTVLQSLAEYHIHSIEQPIKAGNITEMARLCSTSPIPIALDEELIGVNDEGGKRNLLSQCMPSYIILKPSLHGGFLGTEEWVKLAEDLSIRHWYTSALESNVGLNAIAQHVFQMGFSMPQGLGTGSLFRNNLPSPLEIRGDKLWHNPALGWDLSQLSI